MGLIFDEIGFWSEIKLEIIEKYALAYSKILTQQKNPQLYHIYIDAFAGPGLHISKRTGDYVPGSPQIALSIKPPFKEYHFIDIDSDKVAMLNELAAQKPEVNIYIHEGDCNSILLEKVFPRARYEDYRRALCLLDPYGLHLNWEVIQTAGHMKSVDMFLNFPVADMNRNVLWRNPEKVDPADVERMNAYWGDESWRKDAYSKRNLFGFEMKEDNETIALAFQKRLHEVAEFQHVSKPLPMRNSKGAIVYYLFFASQRKVADNIIKYIFDKYRRQETK